jgi:hypothetical protein
MILPVMAVWSAGLCDTRATANNSKDTLIPINLRCMLSPLRVFLDCKIQEPARYAPPGKAPLRGHSMRLNFAQCKEKWYEKAER